MADAKVKEMNSPSKAERDYAKNYVTYDEKAREELGFDIRTGDFPPIADLYESGS